MAAAAAASEIAAAAAAFVAFAAALRRLMFMGLEVPVEETLRALLLRFIERLRAKTEAADALADMLPGVAVSAGVLGAFIEFRRLKDETEGGVQVRLRFMRVLNAAWG